MVVTVVVDIADDEQKMPKSVLEKGGLTKTNFNKPSPQSLK